MEEMNVISLKKARRSVERRNKIFLILSSIFILILFYLLYNITYLQNPWVLEFEVMSLWLTLSFGLFIFFSFFSKYSTDKYIERTEKLSNYNDEESIGGFKVKDVKNNIQEISNSMNIEGKVKVCLMDKTLPNAFGILWRNVICIDKSWLRILDDRELKALVAHELHHLKIKKSRPMFGHPYVVRFVIFLQVSFITAIILFSSGGIFWDVIFFMIIFQWVDTFFLIAPMKASRAEEHLCDWSAIKYSGVEGVINLMLKMGQRYEAVNIIKETISRKSKEYKIPIKGYSQIQTRVDQKLTRDSMTREGIRETVEKTVDELAEEKNWPSKNINLFSWGQKQKINRATKKHKINWLEYDQHIKDFKLDKEEIPNLVDKLVEDEQSFLFDSNIDGPRDSHGTHPTIKNRVLFIWENYKIYST